MDSQPSNQEEKISVRTLPNSQDHSGNNLAGPTDALPAVERTATSASKIYARKKVCMVFINITQLVQMFPFGAGVTAGPAIALELHNHSQHTTQIIQ